MFKGAGIPQSVCQLSCGLIDQDWIPGRGWEFFSLSLSPCWLCGPPSLQSNG